MKTKFIDFCEFHFNGVADCVSRVLLCASAIVALVTAGNIICPIF